MKRLILIAILSALGLSAAGEYSNRRAPGFSIPDVAFKQYDLQDYRGKLVVIEFMQTTCPHCQKFAPILENLKQKYADRVVVLSVVTPPDTLDTVKQYVRKFGLTSPVLLDSGQVTASYLKVTPYNPKVEFPHVFLVDRDGRIRNDFGFEGNESIFEGDALTAEVDKLLSGIKK